MSDYISTFVPYDATGRAVNLDAEYMYRDDGLKLKVIRFEYYKSDDADYNWFILTPVDGSNSIKADRYKVSDLYVNSPTIALMNRQSAIKDLNNLKHKLDNLIYRLCYDKNLYDILLGYALDKLDIEPVDFIGYDARTSLQIILAHLRGDLYDMCEKLEDSDAE